MIRIPGNTRLKAAIGTIGALGALTFAPSCDGPKEDFDPGKKLPPKEDPTGEDPQTDTLVTPTDTTVVPVDTTVTPVDTIVTREFPKRPNVILILADDLGYSDVGCYGSEVETPSIDRLAATGVRFRTFYNAARSAPTRASLLTGLYPHEAGVGALNTVQGYEHYKGYLDDETCTIPEALKGVGYKSFITGKWHLQQEFCKPKDRGFDHSFFFGGGWYWSQDDVNAAALFLEDSGIKRTTNKLPGGQEQWYTSDMFVTMGLQWMDEAIKENKPFFWYMPFNAVHFPIMAKEETIDKYTGRYSEGYTVIRNRRFAKQVQMGLFDEGELTPENPHASYKHWDKMTAAEKTTADKRMAVYAACIENMDQNIGRIITHLEEKGIRDNTLIIFLSDNGGNAESHWPGTFQAETASYPGKPGGPASNIWLGAPWAGVANTPYFLYKRHAHNGGCCTPLIFSWPAGIDPSLQGSIDKQSYGHIVDIMPTILEVTEASYLTTRRTAGGTTYQTLPPEGNSLTEALRGQKVTRTKPIIMEHEGNRMLRDGDWKIVREYEINSAKNGEKNESNNPWRLYNVVEDPTELHDLSARYPDILNRMKAMYNSEAARTFVESGLVWTTGLWYTPVRNYPPVN